MQRPQEGIDETGAAPWTCSEVLEAVGAANDKGENNQGLGGGFTDIKIGQLQPTLILHKILLNRYAR